MEKVLISILAVTMAIFAVPLFLDLAICILGNVFAPRRPRPFNDRRAARRITRLAVVVPAHDEEVMIGRTVTSLKAAALTSPGPTAEIFVVAHNCTDATAQNAAFAGARVVELNDPRQRGKGAALRHGFKVALESGANALLVVDADSVVSPNLISATYAKLAQGAGATQCRYELEQPPATGHHLLARLKAFAFRGMNELRPRGRAGLGFSTGLFGNGFALTASTLAYVPFNVDSIAEDVEYHTRLAAHGVQVYWVEDAWVHAHTPASSKAQANQEARWEGGRLRVASHATPALVRALVTTGRWRVLETLADVWSLPLSRGILALILGWFLAVHWLHVFAVVCVVVTVAYVVAAAFIGPTPLRDLQALTAAPAYVAWKAIITPLVLRQSRSRAAWVRADRDTRPAVSTAKPPAVERDVAMSSETEARIS
jgi:cellulose synthase/poly-beta-1,6-N-acetylglucosamine synthase-like glycosyltransferase